VGEWAPWIALAVLWSLALGGFLSWALIRWGGADPATAYWSGPIGAAAEMVLQGERAGARVELVAAAHSLRLMLVVVILPLVYDRFGLHGSDRYVTGAQTVEPFGLAVLVGCTVGSALLLRRVRGPNPWMLGSLAGALLLTASGHLASALPNWVSPLGQLLIGISLGGRFGPGFFNRAPRFLVIVGGVTLLGLAGSAALAALIGWVVEIPLATLVLATAPGGIAEMCLTAQALQLGVPVVTAFHATRVVTLLLVVQGGWKRSRAWLERVERAPI
jgi:membrane AbrB-like protein